MVRISTFVFFDIETTGLPYQEFNRTKITEMSLMAVTRNDLRSSKQGTPAMSKLILAFNPQRPIQLEASRLTGLTNEKLKYSPSFGQKFNTIASFLKDLQRPVCLVAHNGNSFDFKILLAECCDAKVELPEDLLCVDSLIGFRRLLPKSLRTITTVTYGGESMVTDDEDSFSEEDDFMESLDKFLEKAKPRTQMIKRETRGSLKLIDICLSLFGNTPDNAHRAEDDCAMLVDCVAACQDPNNSSKDFVHWMDTNCKELSKIKPLQRR